MEAIKKRIGADMVKKTFTFSKNQIFWLIMASSPIGLSTLPREINQYTGQSGWLFIILSLAIIILFTRIFLILPERYPGCSLLNILENIIGKWLGRLLFVALIAISIILTGLGMRLLSDGIIVHILFHTPGWSIILSELLIVMYAATKKEETLARFNELIQPLLILTLFTIFLLVINKANFSDLKPIVAKGIIFDKGLFTSLYSYLISWVFLFFLPLMPNFDILKKGVFQGLVFLTITVGLLFIMAISLFGPVEINYIEYPSIDMARLVEIPILERIEIVFLTSWILYGFSLNHLTLLSASVGFKTLFSKTPISRWVIFVGVIVFLVAIYPNDIEHTSHLARVIQLVVTVILFFIFPLIVLIDTVKRKVKQN